MTAPGYPDYTPLGKRLQERTEQLQPEELDAQFLYVHGNLSEAMMRGLFNLGLLVDPEEPYAPWEPLFNVDICPSFALPWLAQCVGVRLPSNVTDQQARDLIKGLGVQARGTPDAVRAAGDIFLIGDKTMYFRERDDGDPYRLEIVIDETAIAPGGLEQIQNAYASQIPAGIVYSIRTVQGWDYQAHTATNATYAQDTANYATYNDLSFNQPIGT
jgi:hypothetical protein